MPTADHAEQIVAHLTRNAVECLPSGELAERMASGRPLRVKLGIDPTAPDIHLGHTVVLQKLREFQDAGHVVVLIIGDLTARVGDPTGRSATRPQLTAEEIDANARTFQAQAATVLRADRLEVRRNSQWLDAGAQQLFDLMRTATVAQLLERDDFARRMAASQPVSLLELLYPLLQGFDSVAVQADVELGGTDQTFNLMQGRALQAAHGQRPQVVLTMPILVGTDGVKKMSKSLDNHIGVTDEPEQMFGRTMSLPDTALASWWELLLGRAAPSDLSPRDSKRALGRALVERFHGTAHADGAVEAFDRVFVRREQPQDVDDVVVDVHGDEEVHLPAVLAQAFAISRAEARRRLRDGAVKLDGHPVASATLDVDARQLDGKVLRAGKRNFARVKIARV